VLTYAEVDVRVRQLLEQGFISQGLHGLQGRLGGSGGARDAYESLKEHARDVYVNGVYPSHESTLHTYSYHPVFLYQTDDGAEGKLELSSVETAPRVEGVRDVRAMYPASNRHILQTQVFCRGLPEGRRKEALWDQGGGCGSATG
jgi:hypothetical protein